MFDEREGKVERIDGILRRVIDEKERIRLDVDDVNKLLGMYFSEYSDPDNEHDMFDELIRVKNQNGGTRRVRFYKYVNNVVGEEIERLREGRGRRVYLVDDITKLLDLSVLPEKIRKRLSDYSNGHVIRRFDRGHVLLRGSRWKSRRY